jgi:alkylhydroperoxidase family enzyme
MTDADEGRDGATSERRPDRDGPDAGDPRAAVPRAVPGGRIPPLSYDDARSAADVAGIPHYMARLSIFQILLRHPRLARAFNDMLAVLLWDNALDARLRELVIMRLGWSTGSVYEWTQHWRIASSLGVPEHDLLGVREWESHPGFGPGERAVLAATDEVIRDGTVSDDTWDLLVAHLPGGEDQTKVLLEVVMAIGAWRMVSSLLATLEVPLEDGVDPWPPDGSSPAAPTGT